jgi:putative ABC transport system substrate-binding protein
MNRRNFVCAMAGGIVLAPREVYPQAGAAPRVGVLFTTTPSVLFDLLVPALRDLGYADGTNIALVPKSSAGHPGSLPALAADIVRQDVTAFVAVGPAAVEAAVAATRSVPIIAVDLESDPVKRGWARSLARPGGNLTGFFMDHPTMAAKWLGLLGEVDPGVRRISLLWDSTTGSAQVEAAKAAAKRMSIGVDVDEIRNVDELNATLRVRARAEKRALVVLSSPIMFAHSAQIAEHAKRNRLVAISPFRPFAESGGLMSYGPDLPHFLRRTAAYIGRILKGDKPGDLPIQQPTKFEFVVNLRTADAIGLTVPQSLLVRADEALR